MKNYKFLLAEAKVKVEMAHSEASLKVAIADSKAEIIKYMITLYMAGFLAMMGAIIGLYFKG